MHTALSRNLEDHQDAATTNRGDFHALDESFHEIICNMAGHPHVWPLIKEQKSHLDRIRYLSLSKERRSFILTDHQNVVAAIADGNTTLAEDRLRAHIKDAEHTAVDLAKRFPDYFEPTTAPAGETVARS